ncbi:hypothetical protein OHB26_13065 [Nocardia sp. NBC_01503]|uniref:hypothetical protein n=1 Tax=Nocardia sp. NBC_01503 TaxID=2975997 RepID=UPI002E7C4228|nr:hypothetical protein [Nocardia sp. NBC_01503]WTL35037.1 hypothetical protein OHB26_13065 [Nocardia sp. NBC_01503]
MTRRHREMNTGVRRALRPAIGALPLALAIAGAGVAQAIPQPGVTKPAQPGTSAPSANSDSTRQPGTTVAPPAPQLNYAVPENRRQVPVETEPAPAINWRELHAPEPVEPVAPIAPPPRTLRVGDFMSVVPDEVPDTILAPVNDGAANVEAAIATGGKSIGINPTRSDKIAAATAAGAAGGAIVGAAAAGIPAAIAGGVGGALIGAGVGAVAGTVAIIGIPAAGAVIGGIAAGVAGAAAGGPAAIGTAAAGALAGAAAGLAPAFALGAPGGAAIGAAVGAAIGAAAVGLPAAAGGALVGGVIGGVAAGAWAGANL